ncbi:MAG: hypothetical protein K9K80_03315, partial [Spirochaetia bacterium]|nr:hypothetical protein [Spirochaetia bacterium]
NAVISELLGYSTVTYRSIYDAYGFSPQRSISAKASAEMAVIDEEFIVSPLSIDGGYADAMIDEYHISLQGAAANNGDFFQDIIHALQSDGSTSSESSLDSIISNSEADLGFSHYTDLQASFFNADEMQMAEYKDNSRLISSIRYNGNDNSVDVFMETDLSLAASIAEKIDGNYEYSQIAFSLKVKDIDTTISGSHYEQIMDRVSSRYYDSKGTEDSEDFKNLCRLLWGSYEDSEDYLRLEITLGNGSAVKTFQYRNGDVLDLFSMRPRSM